MFSFVPRSSTPSLPPLPQKDIFYNSMQASELCQKVLGSLKADLLLKVDAGSMGSTFPPSAGSKNDKKIIIFLTFWFCMSCSPQQRSSDETIYLLRKVEGPSGSVVWENRFRLHTFHVILLLFFFFFFSQASQQKQKHPLDQNHLQIVHFCCFP